MRHTVETKAAVPWGSRDKLRSVAWASFIRWLAQQPEIVDAFNIETGRTFMAKGLSPIEQMIDEVTDKIIDDASAFIEWGTLKYWGIKEAPKFYQECLAKKAADGPSD